MFRSYRERPRIQEAFGFFNIDGRGSSPCLKAGGSAATNLLSVDRVQEHRSPPATRRSRRGGSRVKTPIKELKIAHNRMKEVQADVDA